MTPETRILWRFPDGRERWTDGYPALNLLAHAEMYDIILPQACGGQAECGTCRVTVLEGALTPALGDEEQLRSHHRHAFAENERLSCRARPTGDLVVVLRGSSPPDLREE